MITAFEGDHHFRTYPLERNASFSANCNVLRALLNHPNASLYPTQVRKLFLFVCNYWWDSDGNVTDKWVRRANQVDLLHNTILPKYLINGLCFMNLNCRLINRLELLQPLLNLAVH